MIIVDFETRSEADLLTVGSYVYARHPSTEVLMLAWEDTIKEPGKVHQWFPGAPVEYWMQTDYAAQVYAFNACSFEYEIWEAVMTKKYGVPPMPPARWEDVKALCARYGWPQKLAIVPKAAKIPEQKDEEGKRLIKKFCCPPFAACSGDDWELFKAYNRQDVVTTRAVIQVLPSPKFSADERVNFDLTWEMNRNGLPVDVKDARQIAKVVAIHLEENNQFLPDLTGGAVTKITQVKRIATWVREEIDRVIGVEDEDDPFYLPNMQAETLLEFVPMLDNYNNSTQWEGKLDNVITVLELRQALGLSSIGKYKRILDMSYNGRIYYNANHWGAHTGRITGSGFQMLNLPRAKEKKPDEVLDTFYTGEIFAHNPVMSARALVRHMIHAEPGKIFTVADYSSIEYILLCWVAGEDWAVKSFADKVDQYKELAMGMYHIAMDAVTPEQRQMGKVGILGCGYGMAALRCQAYAKTFGVQLTLKEAQFVVDGFRRKYPKVKALWYATAEAAIMSVRFPGREFSCKGSTFKVVKDHRGRSWLRLTLPSGRNLFYNEPCIEMGKYGEQVCVWGVDQKTRVYCKREMTPGKWVENIIQALGRDLLYHGKRKLRDAGYFLIGSIYDEALSENDEDFGSLAEFEQLLCDVPDWAKGLPLRAEGYQAYRYKKG